MALGETGRRPESAVGAEQQVAEPPEEEDEAAEEQPGQLELETGGDGQPSTAPMTRRLWLLCTASIYPEGRFRRMRGARRGPLSLVELDGALGGARRGGRRRRRHDAHAFVYVLQGSIVMQVRGGKEVTLVPGQTFYEGPNDVHTVGRNASTTEPAKFIVILLKKKGVDVVLPAE